MFEDEDEREESPTSSRNHGYQTDFVGRHDAREEIKIALKRKRLVQILGGPVVGKSRLAEEICNELKEEAKDTETDLKTVRISLRNKDAESLKVIKLKILNEFAKKDVPLLMLDFRDDLDTVLKSQPQSYFLVLFDDCDQMISTDFHRTAFLEMIYSLTFSRRLKVILTSRVQFSLPRIASEFQHTHRLSGLSVEEAGQLMARAAPNVTIQPACARTILKRCCGLPLLLIIVARTLEDKRLMLSPEELCALWETGPLDGLGADLASDEDNIDQIIDKFVGSLDRDLKRLLAVFAYFPGTFSAEAATHLAQFQTVPQTKLLALLRLFDRSMVEFDAVKGRYFLSPIIRDHANYKLDHLRETDTVRLRFCDFFSRLLVKANADLGLQRTDVVFGDVYEEWVNVEQTLREAVLPTSELFRINMQIVRDAPEIITALAPEYAETYYRQCLPAAEMFGTPQDIGHIESCIGCAVGYSKGDGLQEAIGYLQKAESKLPADGYQYVKLMSHFEWNYYRQGNMAEAARYQQKALDITPDGPEKRRIMKRQISVRNHQALRKIIEGSCQEAVDMLLDTLEFTKQNCAHHPASRVMLNSLGLAYAELRHPDKALMYCKASLAERRKYVSHSSRTLVVPLSNVACLLTDSGEHSIALKLVDEALEIRRKIRWEHLDTTAALLSKGSILRKSGKYREAIECLEEVQRIYEVCANTHFGHANAGVQIAQCWAGSGQAAKARAQFRLVIDSRHRLQQQHQLNLFVLQAFELLLELSLGDDWLKTAAEMRQFLETALANEDTLDSERSSSYRDKIHEIQTLIEKKTGVLNCPETPPQKTDEETGKDDQRWNVKKLQESQNVNLLMAVSKLENNLNNMTQRGDPDKHVSKYVTTTSTARDDIADAVLPPGEADCSRCIIPERPKSPCEVDEGEQNEATSCMSYNPVILRLSQGRDREEAVCCSGFQPDGKDVRNLNLCCGESCAVVQDGVPALPLPASQNHKLNGSMPSEKCQDECDNRKRGRDDSVSDLRGNVKTEGHTCPTRPHSSRPEAGAARNIVTMATSGNFALVNVKGDCEESVTFVCSKDAASMDQGGPFYSDSSTLKASSLSDSGTVCASLLSSELVTDEPQKYSDR